MWPLFRTGNKRTAVFSVFPSPSNFCLCVLPFWIGLIGLKSPVVARDEMETTPSVNQVVVFATSNREVWQKYAAAYLLFSVLSQLVIEFLQPPVSSIVSTVHVINVANHDFSSSNPSSYSPLPGFYRPLFRHNLGLIKVLSAPTLSIRSIGFSRTDAG
ncbi:hypothetical protein AHF37_12329 [Paragonimus kellicotti]|nr:hypothetical protein AHF37_12329 [Paragonimus kellicotti]